MLRCVCTVFFARCRETQRGRGVVHRELAQCHRDQHGEGNKSTGRSGAGKLQGNEENGEPQVSSMEGTGRLWGGATALLQMAGAAAAAAGRWLCRQQTDPARRQRSNCRRCRQSQFPAAVIRAHQQQLSTAIAVAATTAAAASAARPPPPSPPPLLLVVVVPPPGLLSPLLPPRLASCSEEVVGCAARDLGLSAAGRRVELEGAEVKEAASVNRRIRKQWQVSAQVVQASSPAAFRPTSCYITGQLLATSPANYLLHHRRASRASRPTCEKDLFMCSSTSMMAAMLPQLRSKEGGRDAAAGWSNNKTRCTFVMAAMLPQLHLRIHGQAKLVGTGDTAREEGCTKIQPP